MFRVNARDCMIGVVSYGECKVFLNEFHRQGNALSSIRYGLFLDGLLVMVMCFGKPRFNKGYQWEVIRECSRAGYLIRGGTSKLWKYFLKDNVVRSCICYHYPSDGKFTSHLIDYCGFRNIKKAKLVKKVYFEGIWDGKMKRIDKSMLERHGVDRLLKTKQGQDRTNEQILLDLGFKKKYEDGLSPQVDSYYPFGVVYRVDDLDDGSFYIGRCEREEAWFNKYNPYLGSGSTWVNHLNAHPNRSLHRYRRNKSAHLYKRSIILSSCNTPMEIRKREIEEIKKFFTQDADGNWVKVNKKCMNNIVYDQNNGYIPPVCSECGGKQGRHFKGCSKAKPCPECGVVNGHLENCSRNKIKGCEYCGRKTGPHKRSCPLFEYSYTCSECGTHNKGSHKKFCSKYKKPKGACPYCGTPAGGKHKKDCPNRPPDKVCPECGYKLSSNMHAPTCSHYKKFKEPEPCSECGGTHAHFASCSKAVKCKECGGANNHHKKSCSKYKRKKSKSL